jgi:hypothetical protein
MPPEGRVDAEETDRIRRQMDRWMRRLRTCIAVAVLAFVPGTIVMAIAMNRSFSTFVKEGAPKANAVYDFGPALFVISIGLPISGLFFAGFLVSLVCYIRKSMQLSAAVGKWTAASTK